MSRQEREAAVQRYAGVVAADSRAKTTVKELRRAYVALQRAAAAEKASWIQERIELVIGGR